MVGLTDFPFSDQQSPFWRKIKFIGMLGKAHKVAIGGGSVGAVLVHLALTVMSSEEKTDWEHFCSFGNMFGH